MKIDIFLKTFFILIAAGTIPLLVFNFFISASYQVPILKDIKFYLGLALFLNFVLAVLAAAFFNRRLASPIKKLIQGAQNIAKGDFETKISIKTGGELEELAEALNKLTRGLKEKNEALEEARAVLEIKVRARTKELKEQAETLGEEAKQRTKELQGRVSELERFQKLSVGRELKMIELKKKIDGLEKKLKFIKGRSS